MPDSGMFGAALHHGSKEDKVRLPGGVRFRLGQGLRCYDQHKKELCRSFRGFSLRDRRVTQRAQGRPTRPKLAAKCHTEKCEGSR